MILWRRHPDLNWGIKVLQTSALPLGYAAILEFVNKSTFYQFHVKIIWMERVKGIEPSQPAWKAGALPLSYTRIFIQFKFFNRALHIV